MPHIIIEYSDNIDTRAAGWAGDDEVGDGAQWLVDAVHAAAMQSPIVPIEGLRTRACPRALYKVGDGDPSYAFLSVVARLGPGRSADEKSEFLKLLLESAERAVDDWAPGLAVAYSAEFQEIDAAMRINRNHVRASMRPGGLQS